MNYLRKSVPTGDVTLWADVGWTYVRPDFSAPDHSVIEWRQGTVAAYPSVSHETLLKQNEKPV